MTLDEGFAPELDLPPYEGHTVRVSILNEGYMRLPTTLLFREPSITGHEKVHLSNYSFLIENDNRNQRVLFDLGSDDTKNAPPAVQAMIGTATGSEVELELADKIPDQLIAQGIDLRYIKSIIWSHTHFDHTGDPSVFPSSTSLVVGPGFASECLPGYPTNPGSTVLDSAFAGRELHELDFSSSSLVIGGFRAIDYFNDGSFFLLATPGHMPHHISALARTTPDSYVLMGGDACHYMGELRPSKYAPLPESVDLGSFQALATPHEHSVCSCAHFKELLPKTKESGPFYEPSDSMAPDRKQTDDTIEKLQKFDASDAVFVIIAHDATLLGTVDVFPKNINNWKQQGWREAVRWKFLKDISDALRGSSSTGC